MSADKITARDGLVAQVFRMETFFKHVSESEKAYIGFRTTVETQLGLLDTMREKFENVQDQIIAAQVTEAAREKEESAKATFLPRCNAIRATLSKLLEELPSDDSVKPETSASSSALPASVVQMMTSLVQQSERRHAQQMELLLSTLITPARSSPPTEPYTHSTPAVKLPQMNLPTFDGKFSQWMSFKDRFTASVVNYPRISNVTRLEYLKSTLTGDAASAVKNIAITDDNFQVAWKILVDKFERKNDIAGEHIRAFYSMPKVTANNPNAIQDVSNIFNESTMALAAMDVTQKDLWLIQFTLDKLDSESRILWGRELAKRESGAEIPTIEEFSKFLDQRCVDWKNAIDAAKTGDNPHTQTNQNKTLTKFTGQKKSATALTTITSASTKNCRCCEEESHQLFKCPKFLKLPACERFQVVKKFSLCRNCFASHMTNTCTYRKCQKCQGRHNILLHDHFVASIPERTDAPSTSYATPVAPQTLKPVSSSSNNSSGAIGASLHVATSLMNQPSDSLPRVFLPTALVNVYTSEGDTIPCRIVLDSAAQVNVMTYDLYSRLNLPRFATNFTISGISEHHSKSKSFVNATISSRTTEVAFTFKCFVLPKISGDIPNWNVDTSVIQMPPHIPLADPLWSVQRPVDLLLCGSPFWACWLNDVIHLGSGLPILRDTVFGFVVVGEHQPVPPSEELEPICLSSTVLNETMKHFFESEAMCGDDDDVTDDQVAAEEHFRSTVSRHPSGRFVVHLPFRRDPKLLGDSRAFAVRHQLALERKFQRNPELRKLYIEVMREQINQGWVELVSMGSSYAMTYYMSHHGVLKDSTTTKLRIVFNASAKSSSGYSLNDLLRVGPTIQPKLSDTLLRFRRYRFAAIGDVSKMYLQILLFAPHADLQRFVWREDTNQPLRDYRVTRVCFGLASSPFLAIRVLFQLAQECEKMHPLASKALRWAFYVDDCLLCCDSLEELMSAQSQLIEVLQTAGFALTKWTSNNSQLIPGSSNSPNTQKEESISIGDSTSSALGLKWDSGVDCFRFSCPMSTTEDCNTKRRVTAAIARLFDPIGLIGPVIVMAKMLLQRIHCATEGWDDPVSEELSDAWASLVQEMQQITKVSVPRWISNISNPSLVELHVCCDASFKAYGACAYIVTSDSVGNRCSRLLASKSRVAPMKSQTIPRLELCGAYIASELARHLQKVYNPNQTFFWCDSMIVLFWIHSTPENFKVFIANRLKKILEYSTPSQWRHIRTDVNPADMISRGVAPEQLATSTLWWSGPSWFLRPESEWPPSFEKHVSIQQDTTVLVQTTSRDQPPTILSKFLECSTSLWKLKRRIAHWLRFMAFLSPSHQRISGPITTEELEKSVRILIRMDQTENFPGLARQLERSGDVTKSQWKQLSSLTPFIDSEGLIRVGGRLQHSEESYATKHPIILPRSPLTDWILEDIHMRQNHLGPTSLLATARQLYWPIGGRNSTRKIVHRCRRCHRANPEAMSQLMGELPYHRVNYIRPFQATGVDYAGPILYRPSVPRGAMQRKIGLLKGYISVFVCMATKAVHLEFVTSLTTEGFIAAFRRFGARRNTPRHMYSDCGKNFEGASKELVTLHQQERFQEAVSADTTDEGVIWHFNPPYSPHQGGLWEACVKRVKYHLSRVCQHVHLTFEEMTTVLCQIEATLNSRPIALISNDPNDRSYLTPGHFLTGAPGNAPPDPNLSEIPKNQLSQWQLCQERAQNFSQQFRTLYLNTLQQRSKWRISRPNIQIGECVLVLDESFVGDKWVLGDVEDITRGRDGRVRVVTVRTLRGTYVRPITKLARLIRDDSCSTKSQD
ncbi:hypothetical protein DMENIID0001_006610 [Sergentomyia squamirostris]